MSCHNCSGCSICRKKYACYITNCDNTDVFPNSHVLVNGLNTYVSVSGNTIAVNANTVSLNSAGSGQQSLVADGVGQDLAVKSLSAGSGVTISDVANVLTISANTVSLVSVGGGEKDLVADGVGQDLAVKSLSAGDNITISDVANVLTISAGFNVCPVEIGANASASTNGTSIGCESLATGSNSIALGYSANAAGNYLALGSDLASLNLEANATAITQSHLLYIRVNNSSKLYAVPLMLTDIDA